MTTHLFRIATKPSDYKICKNCCKPNWYDNEVCCDCESNDFDSSIVLQHIDKEYSFYEEEGYSEAEIDDIEIEC